MLGWLWGCIGVRVWCFEVLSFRVLGSGVLGLRASGVLGRMVWGVGLDCRLRFLDVRFRLLSVYQRQHVYAPKVCALALRVPDPGYIPCFGGPSPRAQTLRVQSKTP